MPTICLCDYLVTITWKRNFAMQHASNVASVAHHYTKNSQKEVHSNELKVKVKVLPITGHESPEGE
jgi:hypothetical protein